MKKYSDEEKIEMCDKINKLQRFVFRYKKDNNKEPTDEEIIQGLSISKNELEEIKTFLKDLEEQDKEFEVSFPKHTEEDRKKAKEIRNKKRLPKIVGDE